MKPSITIQQLSKKYTRTGGGNSYATLRDTLTNTFKKKSNKKVDFWALKDINLEIEQGDRVGIIGRNGAGKSTLLKIISRITPPTSGQIIMNGRVASLLEVGTGFHPELSGRENIYLNGSILGLKRLEITQRLDEIIEFSGVSEFIDTPLKHYSSGMQLRLAFAVAAHLQSEILLIDEVLAVGDLEFQRKCIGKMEEISRMQGRTILFVSHDLNAISVLTNTCIVLEKGCLDYSDSSPRAINHYLSKLTRGENYYKEKDDAKPSVTSVSVLTSEPNKVHLQGEPLTVEIGIHIPKAEPRLALAFIIKDANNKGIVHISLFDQEQSFSTHQKDCLLKCTMPLSRLYMGQYSLHVFLAQSRGSVLYDEVQNVGQFEVTMFGKPHGYKWIEGVCTYIEEFEWKVM